MRPLPSNPELLVLPDAAATAALGERLSSLLQPGDTVLLSGPIGAGKSHFARAAIRALLARENRDEDIPSPTFTLVQTYPTLVGDVWHVDLYRLSHPDEAFELGLEDAFGTDICLVEWPDRLGDLTPADSLHIALTSPESGRIAEFHPSESWQNRLPRLLGQEAPDA